MMMPLSYLALSNTFLIPHNFYKFIFCFSSLIFHLLHSLDTPKLKTKLIQQFYYLIIYRYIYISFFLKEILVYIYVPRKYRLELEE